MDYGPDPTEVSSHTLAQEVDPADMFPPRFCGNDRIEVLASGEFGVFSRPFSVKGEPRVNKDDPLPDDFDRKAKLLGTTECDTLVRSTRRRKPRR